MSNDHTYIASVVALYWFVSISMVYLNKALMSSEGISIDAPLFVTWFQCIVTAIICYIAGEVGEQSRRGAYKAVENQDGDAAEAKSPFLSQFPKAEYKVLTGQRVFPLSLVFVGMITFNNLCLKWVEVSFYNVARSLTIVFNVVFTNLLLGGTTSPLTLACLGVVIFGFFLGSGGEVNFSMRGTIAGVLSSLFVSLNSIYTKKVLPVVDNDHWRLVSSDVLWFDVWLSAMLGCLIFRFTPTRPFTTTSTPPCSSFHSFSSLSIHPFTLPFRHNSFRHSFGLPCA